jgi:hypothetical protein
MRNHVVKGQVFGRLTVVNAEKLIKNSAAHCVCECACGVVKVMQISNLMHNKSKSCGCLAREMTSLCKKTHGKSKSAEYRTWRNMWSRCTNPMVDRYELYGGRGITVCKRWGSFENFHSDMGDKPSPRHSIGRIDNNGNYEPENCRWETQQEQANNTRKNVFIEFKGQKNTYAQWAKITGIPYATIVQRHRAGMKGEKLFDASDDGHWKKTICVNGETRLTTEWMREAKIPISSFYYHARKGLTPEQIVSKYLAKASK